MQKNGFTIIEVIVVFLLILGVTFFVLPKSLDNTRQASFISKWSAKYSEIEYMFSVITAQQDSMLKQQLQVAQTENDRKKILLESVKPYLRITSEVKDGYYQKYMNGTEVTACGRYFFNNFYQTENNEIIGLKWIAKKCEGNNVCGFISIDLNGKEPPNTWGHDIFAVNVYKSKIEPLGQGIDPDILKTDCSRFGFGLYCSYYYLIGGKFD